MPKKTFPAFVPPMMAESAKAPFDAPDWIFEIKLDGYRAITVFDSAGKPHLWSRNGLALEKRYRAHRPNPTADFGGIGLVHVKEVGHHRPDHPLAAVVRRHGDNASKDLDRAAVPIFGDVVKGGETRVDEGPEILRITSRPFHSATPRWHVASSTKQSKPLPKVLASISFQKASSHSGGSVFVK